MRLLLSQFLRNKTKVKIDQDANFCQDEILTEVRCSLATSDNEEDILAG